MYISSAQQQALTPFFNINGSGVNDASNDPSSAEMKAEGQKALQEALRSILLLILKEMGSLPSTQEELQAALNSSELLPENLKKAVKQLQSMDPNVSVKDILGEEFEPFSEKTAADMFQMFVDILGPINSAKPSAADVKALQDTLIIAKVSEALESELLEKLDVLASLKLAPSSYEEAYNNASSEVKAAAEALVNNLGKGAQSLDTEDGVSPQDLARNKILNDLFSSNDPEDVANKFMNTVFSDGVPPLFRDQESLEALIYYVLKVGAEVRRAGVLDQITAQKIKTAQINDMREAMVALNNLIANADDKDKVDLDGVLVPISPDSPLFDLAVDGKLPLTEVLKHYGVDIPDQTMTAMYHSANDGGGRFAAAVEVVVGKVRVMVESLKTKSDNLSSIAQMDAVKLQQMNAALSELITLLSNLSTKLNDVKNQLIQAMSR